MPILTPRRVAFATVFASNNAGQAKVNALRIVPLTPPSTPFNNTPPTSYYIDAGSNVSYTSAVNGTVYSRDSFYTGSCELFLALLRFSPLPVTVSSAVEVSVLQKHEL